MQSSEMEFARIFESGKYLDLLELSDANLRTNDGCNFAIHRVILARGSDYFRRMFLGMGNRKRKFYIPGISGVCLNDILCYLYTEDIRVTETNVADLMIGAHYMSLDDLQMQIKDNIKDNLTEVNCLRILRAAHQIGDEEIFRKCFRFIQKGFEGIMRCHKDELADLPLEVLGKVLRDRSLYVYDEATVWQAIVTWTQKDIRLRMRHFSQLLLTLAIEDVREELATEILQHEIISENCSMKNLVVEIPSSNDLPTTNQGVLATFLRGYSNRFTEPILLHRIPLQLLVVMSRHGDERNLYITYDDDIDLYRKIATGLRCRPDAMTAIGHNVYIFDMRSRLCMNFDLCAMDLVRMKSFRHDYSNLEFCIVATDAYIYVLGDTRRLEISVEVYDVENDRWRYGIPLRNISRFSAAAIERKIYVVGSTKNSGAMMTHVFDPRTQQWSILSPPTIYHSKFSLVAYHRKIYLAGDSVVEVFDPEENLWKRLSGTLSKLSSPKAMVINDQIVVGDDKRFGYFLCWNNAEERWEEFSGNLSLNARLCLGFSKFCTVDDVETIKMITKQNRDPETQMEEKFLFLN